MVYACSSLFLVTVTYVHTHTREYIHTDIYTLQSCILTHIYYIMHGSKISQFAHKLHKAVQN